MNIRLLHGNGSLTSIGRASALVILTAIVTPLPARADDNPPADSGAGGLTTLAGPPPSPGSVEALADVDLSTGAAQMSLPFQLPHARGGVQPSLSLTYSSRAGVGFAGVGWSINVPSFVRKGAAGMPRFVDDAIGTDPLSDTYFFAGKALVPLCVIDSYGGCGLPGEKFAPGLTSWIYFRTENDDGDRYLFSPDHLTWLIQSKSGTRLEFGEPLDHATPGAIERADAAYLVNDPEDTPISTSAAVYRWNLARQYDASGNAVVYLWRQFQSWPTCLTQCGVQFLEDIYDTQKVGGAVSDLTGYAHHTHLRWSLADEQSAVAALSPIWRAQPSNRLVGVDVTSQRSLSAGARELIRRYHLDYSWNSSHTRPYLASFQLEGTCSDPINESAAGLLPDATPCDRMPATTLGYSPTTPTAIHPHLAAATFDVAGNIGSGFSVVDLSGNGLPDLLFTHKASSVAGDPYQVVQRLAEPPIFLTMQLPSPPGQHASITDIMPGSPHAVFGDWSGDGRINVLWLDVKVPNGQITGNNTFETYSLDVLGVSGTAATAVWRGEAPRPLPRFYTFTNPEHLSDYQNGRAIDVDGDGYVDLGFVNETEVQQGRAAMRSYFTAHDEMGTIAPFALPGQRLCVPKRSYPSAYSNPAQRLMADMDGDGIADMVMLEAVQDPGASTFGRGVKAHWFKGRGDGRFGLFGAPLPLQSNKCGNDPTEIGWDITTAGHEYDSIFGSGLAGLRDLDGDGIADFIAVTSAGIDVIFHKHKSPPSRPTDGDNVEASGPLVRVTAAQLLWTGIHTFDASRVQLLFADLDGSGVDELVLVDDIVAPGRTVVIDYASEQRGTSLGGMRAGLLQTVSNGFGATTTISYKSVASLATTPAIPEPAWVVNNVTSTNGLTGPHRQGLVTDYKYETPVYDKREHAFLGFKTVTAMHSTDSNAPSVNTRTTFTTDTCTACQQMVDYWYRTRRGQVAFTEDFDANSPGTHLSTTVNTYPIDDLYMGIDGRYVRRTWLGATDIYLWDSANQDSTPVSASIMVSSAAIPVTETMTVSVPTTRKHLRRSARFDSFGNQTDSIDWGDPDADVPIVTHSDWKVPSGSSTGWNFRPINHIVGYADRTGARLTSGSREIYFGHDSNGLLTSVTARLSGTLPLDRAAMGAPPPGDASVDGSVTVLKATYDTSGNVQLVRPNGKCSRIAYDGAYNQLPVGTAIYRNGCGAAPLTTSRIFDRGLEVVTVEISPAMRMTNVVYDGFGRVVEVDQPSADTPNHTADAPALKVDYALANVGPVRKIHVSRVGGKAGAATYVDSWQYVDGFGRNLFTLRQADSWGWIVEGMAELTATGRVARAFQPFAYAGAGPSGGAGSLYATDALPTGVPAKSFTYDAFGRVLTATGFDGLPAAELKYYPLDLSTEIRNAAQLSGAADAGAFTRVVHDGHGRTKVSEEHRINPNEVVTTSTSFLATGEPRAVQQQHFPDKATIMRWMAYDSMGRLVLNAEPNTAVGMSQVIGTIGKMKAWRYAYNDSNELVGTSDARGCGKNLSHDLVGRLISEDYSPCTSDQAAYTPASSNTGEGTEAFYIYDYPELKTAQDPVSYIGELAASYDRAQHSQLVLDARGRVVRLRRQIAAPRHSTSLSTRYTPHWFEKSVGAYDEQNRVLTMATGADLPELAPAGVGSTVTTSYGARGTITGLTSTYGSILRAQGIDPNGALRLQVFGDVAGTTTTYDYLPNGLLSKAAIKRTKGPWLPTSGTYAPPASGEPNTVQGVLANVTFTYDAVGNPKTTTDTSEPAQWPDGAKPVTSRTMTYDNAYRLASSKTDYAGGSDTFVPPFGTNPTYPAPTPVSTRVRSQTFTYDWLGNTSQSDDDADIFGDRSYGVVVNGAMGAANGPHQLISTSKKSGNQNATYDASGNLATLTVHRLAPCRTSTYNYSWNEVGRLETADRIDGTNPESAYSHYAYDADGNRVTRVTAPNRYEKGVWSVDVFDSLRLEHASYPDAAGDFERTSATESVYLVSNGERMAHVVYAQRDLPTGASGRVHVFLEFGNYLGTTSFVVDRETSELVERASYQAYGAPDSDYRPARWDAFHEAQGYSGKEDDSEVGLTYFGARYYVASIGRWASPDPLAVHALGSDPNPYAYVLGSPTRFTDPSGLSNTDPNAPGCDNLNVGCGSGGLGDFGGLFGFLGGDGGGGGAGPIRSNGSPGAFSRPGYLGGSSASPIVPLAGPRMASVFGDFTVNMGAVRAFNTGVERNSTVLVAVAAVAAAQVAVIAAVAEEAAGLVAMSRISASWANLGRLIGVWSPLAVAVSSKATELISGLNGNSYVVAGEGLVASDGINAPRLAAQLIHEEASSAFTATGELSPEAIEGAKQIFSPGELSNPAIPAGFAKYSTETFGSPSGPFQVHFYMEPLRGEIHYALDYKAVFNGSNGIQPFRAFRGSAP